MKNSLKRQLFHLVEQLITVHLLLAVICERQDRPFSLHIQRLAALQHYQLFSRSKVKLAIFYFLHPGH